MQALKRVGRFMRRHKRAEEDAAATAGLELVWTILKRAGLVGAGIASAAVVSTITSGGGPTYHPQFSLSVMGAAFITRYEGSVSHLYNDPFNCTIGVGHLVHMGVCAPADYKRWPGLTQAQATSLLMHDAATAETYVRESVTHPIDQPQFDALVSFTFNVGGGGLQSSSALRDVNAGDFAAVPAALAKWSSASGHFLAGLYARRQAEAHLFLTGDYGAGIGKYVPPKPAPLTKAQKLRAKTGYWSWLAWQLGDGAWKGYGPANPKVRPHVATRVAHAWWTAEAAHVKAAA
jgi:lysozyme